jgi:hypothetical protein
MNKRINGIASSDLDHEELLNKKIGDIHHYIKNDLQYWQTIVKDLQERNNELTEELKQRRATDILEEGKRQLIEKLTEDIGRYQQELEWYRRTYEKRTWLGLVKQKLYRRG